MNKIFQYAVHVFLLVAFASGTLLLMRIGKARLHEVAIGTIDIEMPGTQRFWTEDEAHKYIENSYGIIVGQRMEDLDLLRIEELMKSRSIVKGCEAWATIDGVLHIRIEQRTPVLRFIRQDSGFYADASGQIFPLQGELDESIHTVEGAVQLALDPEYMSRLLKMQKVVESDRDWSTRLANYIILENGDLTLTDTDGMLVVVGDEKNLRGKLDMYRRYRASIAPHTEEEGYKSVNVKYKDQMICRKDTQLQ